MVVVDENMNNQIIKTKFLHSLIKGVRPVFLLWLLSKNKLHGYAIITQINETYSYIGEKTVHGSTVYPLLHSLEEEGLIISSDGLNGNHKVKYYEISPEGITTLNSIKSFIREKPNNNLILNYLDEMLFSDDKFVYEGGD